MRMIPHVYVDKNGMKLLEEDCPCKVVYINRKHRFFTVEFQFPGGAVRESFKYTEKGDCPCQRKGK